MVWTPEERRAWGAIGGLTTQARHGSDATLKAARAGWHAKWEHEVDPECVLPIEERERRAQLAMRAHMRKLARRSAVARHARARS